MEMLTTMNGEPNMLYTDYRRKLAKLQDLIVRKIEKIKGNQNCDEV